MEERKESRTMGYASIGLLAGWAAAAIAGPREIADGIDATRDLISNGTYQTVSSGLSGMYHQIAEIVESGKYSFMEGFLLRGGHPYILAGGVPGAIVGGLAGLVSRGVNKFKKS